MSANVTAMRRENWTEFSRGLAWRSATVLALLAWLAWFQETVPHRRDNGLFWLTMAAGAVMALLAGTRWPPAVWGAAVQACLALLAVAAVQGPLGYAQAGPFFVIPIALAGLAVSPWLAPVFGLAAWLLLSRDGAWVGHSYVFAFAVIVAAWAQHLRHELDNAWRYAERHAALTAEVRRSQQQVRHLNRSLQVSNGLLKRSFGELAAAQREAQEARHLKEQFATTVSHELRTPLNIIIGFVEVMQTYPEVYGAVNWTPSLRRDIAEIEKSARYLSDLVSDILDLARVQALRMPMHREETDLAALAEDTAAMARRLLLESSSVSLVVEVAPGLPRLFVDRTRIRQVLLNLLANACRFTSEGRIRVTASHEQDEVVVSVEDTGTGIPPDELEGIFDEFRQSSLTEASEEPWAGKGLGLAIAKRFVQMHGGHVWAESVVGRGSRFAFSLPSGGKQVVRLGETVAPPYTPPGEQTPGLVVVAGDQTVAYLSRRLEGYRLQGAEDIGAARRLVREQHPQAVIVSVPPEPEEATKASAVDILPEPIPLIQCSFPGEAWQGEPGPFDAWLVKPIGAAQLRRVLAEHPTARRILVVDDDRSFVRLVRRILETQDGGHRVQWAHSGTEALQRLRDEGADVVLIDIGLPDINGRAVARQMRESTEGQSLILVAVTALQPGTDLVATAPRSFTVTSYAGIGEESILALLRACLEHIRPEYAQSEPALAPEAAQPDPAAS